MKALSLRFKYHAETGLKPLYAKQPVARTYDNRSHYDSYKRQVPNRVYELGLISFSYVIWLERKIEDLFNIWKDDIHKMYKKETGLPVFKHHMDGKHILSYEYYYWIENKFLELIEENDIKYV